jgi:autonomous glycyl radical cofactor GrcA
MKNISFICHAFILLMFLTACSGEQRVEPENTNSSGSSSTGIFGNAPEKGAITPDELSNNNIHEVEIVEVLKTSKYSYLRVQKGEEEPYWIASMKSEFQEGQKILYEGGLLKTNFKSTEYDRVFDRLYLVSKIRLLDGKEVPLTQSNDEAPKTVGAHFNKPDQADIIDLAEVVNDPEKYKDQKIKVYGEVVKVNANIMDRNWLHIKDATADEFDFVLTSETSVPVGHSMIFEGTISLSRDFGAGYVYDLIMENAQPQP